MLVADSRKNDLALTHKDYDQNDYSVGAQIPLLKQIMAVGCEIFSMIFLRKTCQMGIPF